MYLEKKTHLSKFKMQKGKKKNKSKLELMPNTQRKRYEQSYFNK